MKILITNDFKSQKKSRKAVGGSYKYLGVLYSIAALLDTMVGASPSTSLTKWQSRGPASISTQSQSPSLSPTLLPPPSLLRSTLPTWTGSLECYLTVTCIRCRWSQLSSEACDTYDATWSIDVVVTFTSFLDRLTLLAAMCKSTCSGMYLIPPISLFLTWTYHSPVSRCPNRFRIPTYIVRPIE